MSERTVTIFAFGSAGDTRPMAAVGKGLVERGYDVRMLTAARYGAMVKAAGIEHTVLDFDPMDVVSSDEGQALLASRNPISLVRGVRRIVSPLAEHMFSQALATAKGSDAILAPATFFAGANVAEHLGIPHALLHLQPGEPSSTVANPLVGAGRPRGALINRASYTVLEQLTWQVFRPMINTFRTGTLGLPKIPPSGPFRMLRKAGVPVFCGYSAAVVPRPPDWADNVHLTGYWFLDETDPADGSGQSVVDPELAQFVAGGPPPVYVGFGSMVPKDPAAVRRTVADALALAGVRGVLLGPHDEPSVRIDESLLQVSSAPHNWLFPRCAAVVHHGGAGTTAAGMRAGAPTVICPFFSDQPFWAARIAALGAGPQPLPIRELTAEGLAARITTAVTDQGMRARTRSIAAQIATEDGVGTTARLVETWLS
jgi:sterol 3beta-glucosyltransferase